MNNNDLRLLGRAVRKGWNIPDAMKDALPIALINIVAGKGVSHRDKIAAARVVVQMEGQNIAIDPPIQKSVNVNLTEDQVDELLRKELAAIEALETEVVEGEAEASGTEEELSQFGGLHPPSLGTD